MCTLLGKKRLEFYLDPTSPVFRPTTGTRRYFRFLPEPKTYQTQPTMQAPAESKLTPAGNPIVLSPKICLIGASVRAAAESAFAAGYRVTAVDQFGDRDTLRVAEQYIPLPKVGDWSFLALGHRGNAEGSVASNWNQLPPIEQRRIEAFRQQLVSLGESMPILVVGGMRGLSFPLVDVTKNNSDFGGDQCLAPFNGPESLARAARDTIFQIPKSFKCTEGQTERFQDKKWLIKRLNDCGGLGVRTLTPELSGAGRFSQDGEHLVQQWMPGRLYGACLLSNGLEVALLGTCRGRFTSMGGMPFVYCGSVGPVAISDRTQKALLAFGRRLIQQTGWRGLFNVDWLQEHSPKDPSGHHWLLEVNPRWSGSTELLERAWRAALKTASRDNATSSSDQPSVSFLKWTVDACQGKALPGLLRQVSVNQLANHSLVKRIIFSRREQKFDPDCLPIELEPGESLHDLPRQPLVVKHGEPICTLMTCWKEKEKSSAQRYRALVSCLAKGQA